MRCRKKAIKMALHLSVLNKWRGPKEMTALRNFKSLANTMKGWSTSAGDHHWQAGCAIEQLATENETLREENERLLFANLYNTDMFNQMNDARKEAEQERDQLKAQINGMKQAIDDLVRSSEGVAGLHQNGDVAPWDELLTGGRFDEWLCVLDDTPQQCLATHDADVAKSAIRTALRNLGNADLNEKDIADFADSYANQLRQQAKEVQS
jgi:cell division septum initiation protein DivIVA